MKVVNLASGSKGNSTLVFSEKTHILIDVGETFSESEKKLKSLNVDVSNIDAILITHEHSDHIKALASFLRKNNKIKIYAHPKTMIKLLEKVTIPVSCQILITSESFFIGDFLVCAFSLSHDASHCLGFSFFENGKKFSIATDLGYESDSLISHLEGSELVFIESNYDIDMLYYCEKYPVKIRERIASKFGHLSNFDCASIIAKLINIGTKKFALAHISENTNSGTVALKTVLERLTILGIDVNNVEIEVLSQVFMSRVFLV